MMIVLALAAAAAEPAPQVDSPPLERYTLSDPAPRNRLRDFSTDRPDATESPYTVDAGHLQIELSAAEYTLGRDRTRTLDVLPVNLKLGLADNVDLQLLFTPYQRVDDGDVRTEGFSDDTLVRLKINLQGNDGEGVALGVMPFVKLPTGTNGLSNGHVEAGLILPLATALPNGFTLGAMLEADLVYHGEDDAYGVDLIHSITLGHPVAGALNAYIEYVGIAPQGAPVGRASSYQAIGSAGFTYALRDDLVLDFGTRTGFSGASDRSVLFLGASTRF